MLLESVEGVGDVVGVVVWSVVEVCGGVVVVRVGVVMVVVVIVVDFAVVVWGCG